MVFITLLHYSLFQQEFLVHSPYMASYSQRYSIQKVFQALCILYDTFQKQFDPLYYVYVRTDARHLYIDCTNVQ